MTYVEKCLYDYPDNLARIEAMQIEIQLISSLHGQSYEAHAVNSISDPVAGVTARILSLENKIKKTALRTRPVTRLCEELRYKTTLRILQIGSILKFRYFLHESVNSVMREIAISYSTYWRRNQELLYMARKFLNEYRE